MTDEEYQEEVYSVGVDAYSLSSETYDNYDEALEVAQNKTQDFLLSLGLPSDYLDMNEGVHLDCMFFTGYEVFTL